MKKTTILYVMALLCLNFLANAQTVTISLPKIGEKLPNAFWEQEHDFYVNGTLKRQNLNAFRGKLLIIDFFATWCSTCINKLKYMEKLQKGNKSEYNFLLLSAKNTGDTPEKIDALQQKLKLNVLRSTVINDSTMNKLFPHRTVPTYVWISENGVFQGITGSAMLNQANINQLKTKKVAVSKTSGR
ncbi:MAG: redoxin domain-containing protein [Pedobacter sp.]|nr:MAG: redoxin domain-containing protein [Pedobacter sp.]